MRIVQLAISAIYSLRSTLDGQSHSPTNKVVINAPSRRPTPQMKTPFSPPTDQPAASNSDIASPPTQRQSQREYNPNRLDILDFTPHLGDDDPHTVLPDHVVHRRVDMLANYTNGLRTFACYNGAESIRYAHSIGLYTVAGAWIDTRAEKAKKEMDCIISLAKEGVVNLASIGSEALTWGGLSAEQIVAYMELFRMEVPNVAVTTAVKYESMTDEWNQKIIVPAVDLLYINFHPYWSGFHIDDALLVHQYEHDQMKRIAKGKDVWISESGWPSEGTCWNGMAEPSKENQERFLREVMNWTRSEGIVLSWFDAFEQPWKNGNEYCSVASHWGIFESNGDIKPGPSRVFRLFEY